MLKLLNKLLVKKDTDGLVTVDIATVGLTPPPIPTQVVNTNVTLAMLPPPFPTTAVVDTWSNRNTSLDDLLDAYMHDINESTSQAANPLYSTSGVLDI